MNPALSPPAADDGSLIGRVLGGRVALREVLAEGGMATVYRGEEIDTHRTVAVKVMLPHLTRDRGFAQRFRREALIAGRLTHPSIVRVSDHGADGDLYFLVMEMLDGEDIFEVLNRHQRLDEAVARRIVAEVCDALAEAHAQGIVHRDLKPENVFLTRAGDEIRVKVLDFGVAKMMLPDARPAGESEPVLTAMGALLGTPEYLSPEMCRGEAVTPQADLYACGVLLYALVTGKPPFSTKNPIDVTLKHVSEAPVPPRRIVPSLSPGLDALILRALAKQPAQRQESAAALAAALRALGPTPPLPASLLGPSRRLAPSLPAIPREISEAVTVALPPGSGPASGPPSLPAVVSAPLYSPTPAPVPALAQAPAVAPPPAPMAERAPITRRPPAPAAGQNIARIAVAAVVLVLTFLAGMAVGWSLHAPPAPPKADPAAR